MHGRLATHTLPLCEPSPQHHKLPHPFDPSGSWWWAFDPSGSWWWAFDPSVRLDMWTTRRGVCLGGGRYHFPPRFSRKRPLAATLRLLQVLLLLLLHLALFRVAVDLRRLLLLLL
jgi:hypothetical protein